MLTRPVASCEKRMDAPGIQFSGRFKSPGRFEFPGPGSDCPGSDCPGYDRFGDPMLSFVSLLSPCSNQLVNIHQFDDEVQI